jgi:multidrug efflux pump subunit AcrA (membrane-fusion protein)
VSVDPEDVQRAKREIQTIVQQIAELSRTDTTIEQFYEEFLNKVVAALAAVGGAVWTVTSGGMQLTYQINLRSTGLVDNPIGQEQHGRLLQRTLASDEGLLVAPHSGSAAGTSDGDEHAAANATDYLLVMVPVHNDQGPQGVVEVFQRPGSRPATQRGYLRFLQQTCDLAGEFLRGRRLRHLAEKQGLWEQLESFTRTAHETLDVREAAYTIANEGRRLIGCDRVSVAIQRGSRCTVEAVSGQDTFDKRSNVVSLLNRVARAVTKTAEDVWYTGDTSNLAPQVEKTLDAYVDESHTKTMAILPLFKPDRDAQEGVPNERKRREVIGALIVEQMVDTTPSEGFTQRVEVVRTHSATAIANALEHNSLFLMPVWKTLGKATSLFRGRTKWKTLAITSAVAAAIVAALYYHVPFNLEGDGSLKPVTLKGVFARIDGEITENHVSYNQPVNAGDLLVEMKSLDLDQELVRLRGQLSEIDEQITATFQQAGKQLTPPEEIELSLKRSELRMQRTNAQALIAKREEQLKMLRVTSPISGRVITGKSQIEQLTNRPISRGQQILEIAELSGDWYLEVLMPESRMRHVAEAWEASQKDGEKLKVTFYLATQPAVLFTGYVETIETTAEARGEEGNTVLLRVAFEPGELERLRGVIHGEDPKVGTEAIAKVHCGDRAIGYVYLHDLWDFLVRSWFRIW